MVMLWAGLALGATVVCDPERAAFLVEQARIDPVRIPVTHPYLVPGLARGADPEPALAAALDELCGPGVTVDTGPSWSGAEGSAHVIVMARAEPGPCELVQRRAALSVGVIDGALRFALLDVRPVDRTPLPGCGGEARWHTRDVLDGGSGSIRLVVQVERVGERVVRSSVEVLSASPRGWTREVLLTPAPARYLVPGGGGPAVRLGETRGGDTWVVASGDRASEPCRPRPGQTVWRRVEGAWVPFTGREALTLLATEGLWQLAGDAGWFLILTQGAAADAPLLRPRLRRLQRHEPTALYLYPSSAFPGLNPGYLFIAGGPWPSAAEAERARRPRQRGAYVKQAWPAPDPCRDVTPSP